MEPACVLGFAGRFLGLVLNSKTPNPKACFHPIPSNLNSKDPTLNTPEQVLGMFGLWSGARGLDTEQVALVKRVPAGGQVTPAPAVPEPEVWTLTCSSHVQKAAHLHSHAVRRRGNAAGNGLAALPSGRDPQA